MSNLSNQYISSSYQAVLNLEGVGSGLTTNTQYVTDGYGNNSPLKLSTTTVEINGTLNMSGSIIPAVSNSVDLGSPTKPFRHIYAGSGSVYLDANPILSLQDLGTNTALAAPPGGALYLLNDIVFDAASGSGYQGGGNLTMQGNGISNSTTTTYTGSIHLMQTDGAINFFNNVDGSGTGSYQFVAQNESFITHRVTDQSILAAIIEDSRMVYRTTGSVTGSGINTISLSTDTPNGITELVFDTQKIDLRGPVRIGNSTNLSGSLELYGNQSVIGTIQASDTFVGPQYYAPTVFQGVGTTAVAYDQFVNGGNYDALHIETNLDSGSIFQDYNGGGLNTWLHIPSNPSTNPAPQFTRGLGITGSVKISGSLNISGNTITTGSLYVSSSIQKDVIVEGQLWVSSSNTSASGALVQPQINVVGGAAGTQNGSRSGSVVITPTNITNTRGSAQTLYGSSTINQKGINPGIITNGYTESSWNLIASDDALTYDNEIYLYADSTGEYFKDWDNTLGDYSTWMHIGPNDGVTIPSPQFDRGLGITGSAILQGYSGQSGTLLQVNKTFGNYGQDIQVGDYNAGNGIGIAQFDDGNGWTSAGVSIAGNSGSYIDMYANGGNYDSFHLEVNADNTGVKFLDYNGSNLSQFMNVGTLGGDISLYRNTKVSGSLSSTNSFTQVKMTTGQTVTAGSDVVVNFDTVNVNNNGWFNTSTHVFTPTVAGTYEISFTLQVDTGTGNGQMNAQINKNNGTQVLIIQDEINKNQPHSLVGSALVDMNGTTDNIRITFYTSSNSGSQTILDGNGSIFKAVLL